MLGYLSLEYRCSSNKFCFLLWVVIDRNISEIRYYELHLQVPSPVSTKRVLNPRPYATHHIKALAVHKVR